MNKLSSFALAGIAIALGTGPDSNNASQIDVYATAPGADIAASAPLGSFSFGEDLGPLDVPHGGYQVRVTLPDEPGVVVLNSGTLTLDGGLNLNIRAAGNTTPSFVAFASVPVADFNG